ncbi:hypothetical protein COO60DRAFT_1462014 [Scenedesmus sp. NREL 46B-D3]|nr:hypothetical protein COO60DRAFT_1462014 [Scenedesmus sp. NREL 46B-D3]
MNMAVEMLSLKASRPTQVKICILLTVTLIINMIMTVQSQGLNPPGELGVSPAEAEKCDEHLADDFDALTKAANKLSTRADILSMRVLAAAEGQQTKPGASSCASSWDVLKNQLHVALAPAVYSTSMRGATPLARDYLPYVRDQGYCNTCVGQANAGAAQAAIACRTLEDARQPRFNFSALSLYYCQNATNTRSCKSGWDNLDAASKIALNPQPLAPCQPVQDIYSTLLVPGTCSAALSCEHPKVTTPRCGYVNLATFVDMQRHIRSHGAVISRVNLYMPVFKDFFASVPAGTFNKTVLGSSSATESPIGHAILVVGYDNANMEWTVLNSWGEQFGNQGLFKVKYGMLGTGSITDTYGLICSASNNDRGLFATQMARRLRVFPTKTPGIYLHTINIRRTPSLSYLADAFNINILDVLSDNLELLPITLVERTEDLADAETLNRLCLRDKVPFGCISSISPSPQCRRSCKVSRWLLSPGRSLNGIQLRLKIPQRFPQLPGAQGDVLSTFGQFAALVCAPGKQAVGQYMDKCGTCPAGTYKNNTGASVCRKCPAGMGTIGPTPADHDSLVDCVCSPGREQVNGTCRACRTHMYKPAAGNEPCLACPANSFTTGLQPSQHDELADCRCQRGLFMTPEGACQALSRQAAAGANMTAPSIACAQPVHSTFQASPSLQPCRRCPDGTITLGSTPADHNSSTSCTCMAGQYKVGASCSTCPANTYKAVPSDARCVPCPPGTATFNKSIPSHHDNAADCRTVWKDVASGGATSCGIMALNDSIACWGGTPDTLPGSLPITQLAWKAVTVGGFHACGILKNDTVSSTGSRTSVTCYVADTLHDAAALQRMLSEDARVSAVYPVYSRQAAQGLSDSSPVKPAAVDGTEDATGLADIWRLYPDLNGKGINIGVIDSGIAYYLPSMGPCSGVNATTSTSTDCRVVKGFDFVGNGYDGTIRGYMPEQDNDPRDCMGHGTLVTSIAAGYEGIAPQANIGAYRVFGCAGDATDDVIIAAIERAVLDGMDIINLSVSDRSGYPEGPYTTVMSKALKLGVLFAKAAGNYGAGGPFEADANIATGSIVVGSIDNPVSTGVVRVSAFSAYGPEPSLEMNPHLLAPGGSVYTRSMNDLATVSSGTSMSAAYMSGLLALWLQFKRQQNITWQAGDIAQAAALRDFMLTSHPVRDQSSWEVFYEPVARVGAVFTVTVTVGLKRWAPPNTDITYRLEHLKGASIRLSGGWYGSDGLKVYMACDAQITPDTIVIRGAKTSAQPLQITFKISNEMVQLGLLFSGYIRLVPLSVGPGYSRNYSTIGVQPAPRKGHPAASSLSKYSRALCYAPGTSMVMLGRHMDSYNTVPNVCGGGVASENNSTITVSLAQLRRFSDCALRITLAIEIPVRRRTEPWTVSSYCLGFNGSFTPTGQSKLQVVQASKAYRLRAYLEGPVAAYDSKLGWKPKVAVVRIKGIMRIRD